MEALNIFRPLEAENYIDLLNILEKFLPDSAVAYNWVLNHSNWRLKVPNLKIQILCPNGDWREGIMVGLADGLAVPNKIYATAYAPEAGVETLKNGILTTDLIEWKRMKCFSAVLERLIPAFTEIMKVKGFKHTEGFHVPCYLNYMHQKEAANYPLPTLPQNVRVGALEKEHLDIVCENWRHYDYEYRPVVEKMIELNPSYGVFVKNEQGEEELASMVLQSEYGGVGLLQTVPKFRRHGYASIALAYLTRALGLRGIMPHGHILLWNKDSSTLFEKHGYKVHGVSTWIIITKENK